VATAGERQSLADIVRDFMEREGLTLQAMAQRTGLSIASIAALRAGSRGKRPQPHTLTKLAQAMGYDEIELALAVDVAADDRRREQHLLSWFRDLDEEGKGEVEQLLARLWAQRESSSS
jgi:transcriptional regulator with XRE-family HTH domain